MQHSRMLSNCRSVAIWGSTPGLSQSSPPASLGRMSPAAAHLDWPPEHSADGVLPGRYRVLPRALRHTTKNNEISNWDRYTGLWSRYLPSEPSMCRLLYFPRPIKGWWGLRPKIRDEMEEKVWEGKASRSTVRRIWRLAPFYIYVVPASWNAYSAGAL